MQVWSTSYEQLKVALQEVKQGEASAHDLFSISGDSISIMFRGRFCRRT